MTTINLQVGAGADDAFQGSTDVVSLATTTMNVERNNEHGGLRWTNVTIPNGAIINEAALSLNMVASGDMPQHQVRGEAADNPGTFTTGTNDIDGRSRTSASVNWDSTDLGAVNFDWWEWGAPNGSPTAGANLNTIIQEIVNRSGWASGNALVLIYEQHTLNTARDLTTTTYDSDTSRGAKLDIDYSFFPLDTRSKRASAIYVSSPWRDAPVLPD